MFVLVLLFTGGQVAAIMSDVTLEVWSTKSESEQENPNLFYTFLALTLTATVAGFVRIYCLIVTCIHIILFSLAP